MAQSAMSAATLDWEWDPPSHNLDEWLVFKNDLKNNANDPSSKLTKHEIAEQVLHDIKDLGRNDTDVVEHNCGLWLDYSPLFDEIQTLASVEEVEIDTKQKTGNCNLKLDQDQPSNDVFVLPEIHKEPSVSQDLFSVSYENATTFILSNENVLYVGDEPLVTLAPLQLEQVETIGCESEETSPKEPDKKKPDINGQPDFRSDLKTPDLKMEMAIVDEIIRNTALELDQWESDTSRSEISSPGMSGSDFSPKGMMEDEEEGQGEETDDPDWKPDSLKVDGRRRMKRPKPYCRGENQEKKKLRKKEQNRKAASRYRQKLKDEGTAIKKEEELLKDKKAKLEERMADIQSEIKSIKSFMRDFFAATGAI